MHLKRQTLYRDILKKKHFCVIKGKVTHSARPDNGAEHGHRGQRLKGIEDNQLALEQLFCDNN